MVTLKATMLAVSIRGDSVIVRPVDVTQYAGHWLTDVIRVAPDLSRHRVLLTRSNKTVSIIVVPRNQWTPKDALDKSTHLIWLHVRHAWMHMISCSEDPTRVQRANTVTVW